jgi:predicted acyltransferase
VPIDKHLLSTSYLLLTFGVAAMGLAALTLVERVWAGDIPPLGALGRNPLLGYMLGGILTLAVRAWVPAEATAPAAWAASLGTLALVTAVALILDARRVYVRL